MAAIARPAALLRAGPPGLHALQHRLCVQVRGLHLVLVRCIGPDVSLNRVRPLEHVGPVASALSSSVAGVVCRSVPAFEHVLLVRISQLLITQLQNLLDPACEPGAQASVLRIVLRVSRTVLQQFHRQLGPKNGVLLEALLSGGPLAQPSAWLLWPSAWLSARPSARRWAGLCFHAAGAAQAGPSTADCGGAAHEGHSARQAQLDAHTKRMGKQSTCMHRQLVTADSRMQCRAC